jgi:hypothetical protein
MGNLRKSVRIQMALPLCYARLTTEETELVEAGKGDLLLGNSASTLPLELPNSALAGRASEQEALMLQYLQLLDAKLNWLIERFGDEEKDLTDHGETLDLGGNGLCFVTAASMPIGTLLRMKLKLSSTALPVYLLAKVLRVEPRTNGKCEGPSYSVAVRFVHIGDVQREQIIQFIFGQKRQELRRRKENLAAEA